MKPAADRLVTAHYALQMHLYFTERVDLGGAEAFLAADMDEPQWNHVARLAAGADAGTVLEVVERFFAARRLPPAVEVHPDLGPTIRARGYERAYRYAWLLAPDDSVEPEPTPPEVEIRDVRKRADADAFFAVFRAVYGDDLAPGYERALRQPGTRSAECEVVHHLALRRGEPAAVATSLHGLEGDARHVTGLYDLAVDPRHRRRGLGGLLTRHRVAAARRRGQDVVFLQTERDAVESWQRRHGFRPAFTTEGWVRRD